MWVGTSKAGDQMRKMNASWAAVALALAFLGVTADAYADHLADARARVAAERRAMGPSLALGRQLHRAGLLTEAQRELRRGIALPATRGSDDPSLIRRELALVVADLGKLNDALRYCQQIGSVGGARVLVHACAAEAHMARKKATDALLEVEKAQALVADHYESRVVEGQARWQNGTTADAERAFRAAIAKDPGRPEAHLELGRLLMVLGRKAEAVLELEKAYGLDEGSPDAAFAYAEALGRDAKVQGLLESAVRERPGFAAAHARLAELFLYLSNWEAAEKSARAALACSGAEGEWHATLGMALLKRNQLDSAMAEAEATLRVNSVSARAKLLQAEVHAARGDIDLAIEAFQSANSNDHGDPTALVRGAETCLRMGRETTARGFADKATQTFPNWGPAWEVLGDVQLRAGEKAPAREAYRRALLGEGPINRATISQKIAQIR